MSPKDDRKIPDVGSEEEVERTETRLVNFNYIPSVYSPEITVLSNKPVSRDDRLEDDKIKLAKTLLYILLTIICISYVIEYFRNETKSAFDILEAFLIGIVGILIGFLFPAKFK